MMLNAYLQTHVQRIHEYIAIEGTYKMKYMIYYQYIMYIFSNKKKSFFFFAQQTENNA